MHKTTCAGSISITLDAVLNRRGMSLAELSRRTGISRTNLDKLKNGRAKGIIWETLAPLCFVLACQPGDIIRYSSSQDDEDPNCHGGCEDKVAVDG